MAKIARFTKKTLIVLIKFYRCVIRPYLGSRCRFHPSCSSYAEEAISLHGCFFGCYLSISRILRCHPFCKGGYDPVPNPIK